MPSKHPKCQRKIHLIYSTRWILNRGSNVCFARTTQMLLDKNWTPRPILYVYYVFNYLFPYCVLRIVWKCAWQLRHTGRFHCMIRPGSAAISFVTVSDCDIWIFVWNCMETSSLVFYLFVLLCNYDYWRCPRRLQLGQQRCHKNKLQNGNYFKEFCWKKRNRVLISATINDLCQVRKVCVK